MVQFISPQTPLTWSLRTKNTCLNIFSHFSKTEYGTWNLRYLSPECAEDIYKCPAVEKYEVWGDQGLIIFGTIDWIATTLTNSFDKV